MRLTNLLVDSVALGHLCDSSLRTEWVMWCFWAPHLPFPYSAVIQQLGHFNEKHEFLLKPSNLFAWNRETDHFWCDQVSVPSHYVQNGDFYHALKFFWHHVVFPYLQLDSSYTKSEHSHFPLLKLKPLWFLLSSVSKLSSTGTRQWLVEMLSPFNSYHAGSSFRAWNFFLELRA